MGHGHVGGGPAVELARSLVDREHRAQRRAAERRPGGPRPRPPGPASTAVAAARRCRRCAPRRSPRRAAPPGRRSRAGTPAGSICAAALLPAGSRPSSSRIDPAAVRWSPTPARCGAVRPADHGGPRAAARRGPRARSPPRSSPGRAACRQPRRARPRRACRRPPTPARASCATGGPRRRARTPRARRCRRRCRARRATGRASRCGDHHDLPPRAARRAGRPRSRARLPSSLKRIDSTSEPASRKAARHAAAPWPLSPSAARAAVRGLRDDLARSCAAAAVALEQHVRGQPLGERRGAARARTSPRPAASSAGRKAAR